MSRVLFAFLALTLHGPSVANPDCQIANQNDAYVLAVNWQPGFCKNRKNHPECDAIATDSIALTNFSLHGLWPNKKSCNSNYAFCDAQVPSERPTMCDLPTVTVNPRLVHALREYMPSTRYGSCLERHEWWKHGTCSDLSEDEYFDLSLSMLHQINRSDLSQFMRSNAGKEVSKKEFNAMIDSSFGNGASKHFSLRCRKSIFEELQIQLPKEIGTSALRTLIQRSALAPKSSCGDYISIVDGSANLKARRDR